MREETLDPEHQTTGDTKEGLYFGREVDAHSAEAHKPLHGPNQWPDEVGVVWWGKDYCTCVCFVRVLVGVGAVTCGNGYMSHTLSDTLSHTLSHSFTHALSHTLSHVLSHAFTHA